MGEFISKTNLKKEDGYLYYISFDKEGYLLINRAKLYNRRGKKKKKKRIW